MNQSLGILTLIIAVISYSFYFTDVFRGRTKPHGFSWLVWAILSTFIFYQQMTHGAGAGAWATASTAVATSLVFLASFKYGEKNITRLDWVCLLIAFVALGVWLYDFSADISVILASSVFVIGFIPTFRKSLKRAQDETLITFVLNSTKFFLALFALNSFTLTTALYPFVLFSANGLFAIFLFTRQLSVKHNNKRRKHV